MLLDAYINVTKDATDTEPAKSRRMWVGQFLVRKWNDAPGIAYRRAYLLLENGERLGDKEGKEEFLYIDVDLLNRCENIIDIRLAG